MFLIVTHSKYKINVILSILYAASVSVVLTSESQRWTCRLFRAAAASGFEGVFLIILSSINQPFSESCGFDESKRIILDLFLADVCFIDPFFLHGAFPDGQSCFFACRNGSLILIYRHRVKSVCKSLNSHGELSIC